MTELLANVRKLHPKDSPQLAEMLVLFGLSLLQADAFPDAAPLLRECLAIREKTQPNACNPFNAMSILGGTLLGQKKKYADAEPLLLAGYQGLKQDAARIPTGGKPRLTGALERLMQLCDAWGKREEAARWKEELKRVKAR